MKETHTKVYPFEGDAPAAETESAAVAPVPPYRYRVQSGRMPIADGDYHQAFIVFAASPKVPLHWKAYYAAISIFAVSAQIFASMALIVGMTSQRCDAAGSSCDSGMFCADHRHIPGFSRMSCWPCGGSYPSTRRWPASAETITNASFFLHSQLTQGSDFAARVYMEQLEQEEAAGLRIGLPGFCKAGVGLLTAECNACYNDKGTFTTRGDVLYDRVFYTSPFDWFMLLLCSFLIAQSASLELREIRTMLQMINEVALPGNPARRSPSSLAFIFLAYEIALFREITLLPFVVSTVPMFALGIGMDPLNVALNAMAVLFILEVDNKLFEFMLSVEQQEYVASLDVGWSLLHPQSPRARFYDLLSTASAVILPLVTNQHLSHGGGFVATPLFEAFNISTFTFTFLNLLFTVMEVLTGFKEYSKLMRLVVAVFSVSWFLLHVFITFQVVTVVYRTT